MENTANTVNATETNNDLIEVVKQQLGKLKLPRKWAAEWLGYTNEYLRKLFKRTMTATQPVLEKLLIFKKKLEEIENIMLAA